MNRLGTFKVPQLAYLAALSLTEDCDPRNVFPLPCDGFAEVLAYKGSTSSVWILQSQQGASQTKLNRQQRRLHSFAMLTGQQHQRLALRCAAGVWVAQAP